jgi:hypothetical protein
MFYVHMESFLPLRFFNQNVFAFLIFSLCADHLINYILLDLITLNVMHREQFLSIQLHTVVSSLKSKCSEHSHAFTHTHTQIIYSTNTWTIYPETVTLID